MTTRILPDPIRECYERGGDFAEVVRVEAERSQKAMLENARRRVAQERQRKSSQ